MFAISLAGDACKPVCCFVDTLRSAKIRPTICQRPQLWDPERFQPERAECLKNADSKSITKHLIKRTESCQEFVTSFQTFHFLLLDQSSVLLRFFQGPTSSTPCASRCGIDQGNVDVRNASVACTWHRIGSLQKMPHPRSLQKDLPHAKASLVEKSKEGF